MIVEVLFSRSDGVSVEFIAHAQLVGLKVGLLRLGELNTLKGRGSKSLFRLGREPKPYLCPVESYVRYP
jgi:hypothetical protein